MRESLLARQAPCHRLDSCFERFEFEARCSRKPGETNQGALLGWAGFASLSLNIAAARRSGKLSNNAAEGHSNAWPTKSIWQRIRIQKPPIRHNAIS